MFVRFQHMVSKCVMVQQDSTNPSGRVKQHGHNAWGYHSSWCLSTLWTHRIDPDLSLQCQQYKGSGQVRHCSAAHQSFTTYANIYIYIIFIFKCVYKCKYVDMNKNMKNFLGQGELTAMEREREIEINKYAYIYTFNYKQMNIYIYTFSTLRYTCRYIYIHIYICICIFKHIHTHTYIYIYIYTHTYIYTYIHMNLYIYIYIIHLRIYMYIYIHVRIRLHNIRIYIYILCLFKNYKQIINIYIYIFRSIWI